MAVRASRKNFPDRVKARRESAKKRLEERLALSDSDLISSSKRFKGKKEFPAEEVNEFRSELKEQLSILEERIK